jgi:multidrug efflux pump subunit AcrA (membrane-fusion protein)
MKDTTSPSPSLVKNRLRQLVKDGRRRVSLILADRARRPFFIAGTFFGALLVVGCAWWLLRPPEIAAIEIQPRSIEVVLAVVARVRPDNLVDVLSPNAGQVVRLLHDDGDVVSAGEPLAVIRSSVEQAQTDASRARERGARAEVDRARLAFTRTRTLAERGFASAAALDEARAVLRSAEAGLAAAAAEQRAASAQTGEFIIRAPETNLFQLGSRDGVELQAEVDEGYADALRPDMAARAALSGSDAIFGARITEISPRVDPTTGGRLIKLRPVEAMSLPPGRSVDVTIVVERREGGITVPRQAVIDATTEPRVYVIDQRGAIGVRTIEIADWPSLNAIVERGLAAGDRVVLTPTETRPRARVRARLQAAVPAPGS